MKHLSQILVCAWVLWSSWTGSGTSNHFPQSAFEMQAACEQSASRHQARVEEKRAVNQKMVGLGHPVERHSLEIPEYRCFPATLDLREPRR